MRVLLLLSESWNDELFPNNNMTNWFTDFDGIRLFTVSGSGTLPKNACCSEYFLISENDMIKSLFSDKKAGREYTLRQEESSDHQSPRTDVGENTRVKRLFSSEPARLCQDMVWRYGRVDTEKLKAFVDRANPDIIFSQRMGSVKMCRLEKMISRYSDAPMIVYTGDDDYSLRQFSLSPVYWVRRFWARSWIARMMKRYKLVYCQSANQQEEFESEFSVKTKFLVKCGEFREQNIHTSVHSPIHIVYAGKLYCNRWKTLRLAADTIRGFNQQHSECRFVLDIYTRDRVSKRQSKALHDGVSSIIHGAVDADRLQEIYRDADIALHAEGLDLRNSLLTKHSFSTKVMDCLSSGCALMIFSRREHAAFRYFAENHAAITVESGQQLYHVLNDISKNPEIISDYSERAYRHGKEQHNRIKIQEMMLEDFRKAIC